ncbi:hypothetical protein BGZ80_002883 [Entomortierella chlamydospora]|uniref:Uncharacterized protein n=1 Tax=Entomortierella chlamydospora TaxID=101097 RepID=A0A9P6MPW0_9FUNG|nr:hypothetical protein BGZ80_002883 [Entomortierella chlamydospora]
MPKLAEGHLDMSMILALRFCKVTLILLPKLHPFQRRIHGAILRFIEQEASVFLEHLQKYCSGGTIAYWQAYCARPMNSDILQEARNAQEQQVPSHMDSCEYKSGGKDLASAKSDKGSSQGWSPITQNHGSPESSRPTDPGFAAFSSKTASSTKPDLVQRAQMFDDKVSAAFGTPPLGQHAFTRPPQITFADSKTVASPPLAAPSITITTPTPTWSTTSSRSTLTSSASSVAVGTAPMTSVNSDKPKVVLPDPPKSGVQHLIQRFNKPSKPATIDSESVEGAIQQWRINVHPVAPPVSDPVPQLKAASTPFSQEIKSRKPIGSTGYGMSSVSSSGMNESVSCSEDSHSSGKMAGLRVLSEKEIHNSTSGREAFKRRVDITLQRSTHMEDQFFNDIVEARTNVTMSRIFGKEPLHTRDGADGYRVKDNSSGVRSSTVLSRAGSLPEKSVVNTMNEMKQANFTKKYKEDNEHMGTRDSGTGRDTSCRRQSSVTILPKEGVRPSLVKSMVNRLNGALPDSPMVPSTAGSLHENSSFARNSVSPSVTPSSSAMSSLTSPPTLLEISQSSPDSASVKGQHALEPASFVASSLAAVGSRSVSDCSRVKMRDGVNTTMDVASGQGDNVYEESRGSKSEAYGSNFGVHDSNPKTSSPSFNFHYQPKRSPKGPRSDAALERKSARNIDGVDCIESGDDRSDDGSLQYLDIDPHYEPDEWLQDNINDELDKNDEGDQDTASYSTSTHSPWKRENDIHSVRVADALKTVRDNGSPPEPQQINPSALPNASPLAAETGDRFKKGPSHSPLIPPKRTGFLTNLMKPFSTKNQASDNQIDMPETLAVSAMTSNTNNYSSRRQANSSFASTSSTSSLRQPLSMPLQLQRQSQTASKSVQMSPFTRSNSTLQNYSVRSTILGTLETPIPATSNSASLNVREATALVHERGLFRKPQSKFSRK